MNTNNNNSQGRYFLREYVDFGTIVTIWLTIMPKISIIILLLELQEIATIGTIESKCEQRDVRCSHPDQKFH